MDIGTVDTSSLTTARLISQDQAVDVAQSQETATFERNRIEAAKQKSSDPTQALQQQAFLAPLSSSLASSIQDATFLATEQGQVQATSALGATTAFANGQTAGQPSYAQTAAFSLTANGSYALMQQILVTEPSASSSLDLMA